MNYDFLLNVVNTSVLPAWLMLILLPNWKGTAALVHSMLYPLFLGGLYITCFGFVIFAGHGAEGGNFTSIDGIRALFSVICLSGLGKHETPKDAGSAIGS